VYEIARRNQRGNHDCPNSPGSFKPTILPSRAFGVGFLCGSAGLLDRGFAPDHRIAGCDCGHGGGCSVAGGAALRKQNDPDYMG